MSRNERHLQAIHQRVSASVERYFKLHTTTIFTTTLSKIRNMKNFTQPILTLVFLTMSIAIFANLQPDFVENSQLKPIFGQFDLDLQVDQNDKSLKLKSIKLIRTKGVIEMRFENLTSFNTDLEITLIADTGERVCTTVTAESLKNKNAINIPIERNQFKDAKSFKIHSIYADPFNVPETLDVKGNTTTLIKS